MAKRALIFWGGWDGHEPKKVAKRFQGILEAEGFAADIVAGAEALPEYGGLLAYDLLVPITTDCQMSGEISGAVARAVGMGVGIAGCHGGMCDAYRGDVEWQFMTGGQWVSHPGGDGVTYAVNIRHGSSPITEGLEDFEVTSEQYYMHVDPAVEVLATTRFPVVNYYHAANKAVDMPVAWTKFWGLGRVFYCSLGHVDSVFVKSPAAQEFMRRGFLWAAGGKEFAAANGRSVDQFLNSARMY